MTAAAFESQEAMIITDANYSILQVNKAFTQAAGYKTDEIVGQTPHILKSGRYDTRECIDEFELLLKRN